jgi:hypothetical protein
MYGLRQVDTCLYDTRRAFIRIRISAPELIRLSTCSKPSTRNGLLLARSDCSLSKTTAARSKLLTYSFGEILNSSSSPFGLALPPSAAFVTPPGMFVAQSPLPSRELKILKRPSNFRSPSGLSSLGIVALSQRHCLRSLPWYPARFPFAPRKSQLL